ncbi:class I SAM-dependent methyltransferase [Phenylobacterium immobile]|uniref:class I SAM-dependent methyltransferase n=1 Tax=Phenylobacterium immobile TaxID=21 RepID=UPI000AE06BA4|nr:class I SAM-dependent methyltransferase [Phenylobacterium immobile]
MDGSSPIGGAPLTYTGPRDYRTQGRHGVTPELHHDDVERFNYLAQVNRYLGGLTPVMKTAYAARAEAKFVQEAGRKPKNRHEARKALLQDPIYQSWSALKRSNMELRQQAGRWIALSQAEDIAAKVAEAVDNDPRLELNRSLPTPRYLTEIDHHCMPGSYHTEYFPGDVTNAINYDVGFFVTIGGTGSPWLSSCGDGMVDWLKAFRPDFKPKRILDVGATMGHNTLPFAQAFPDCEVICVDLGVPMLRYGLARAKSMGVDNVRFIQADVTDLSKIIEDESIDLVFSAMFLHEISFPSMQAIFKENHRVLKKGGMVIHLEQGGYNSEVAIEDQAIRDWGAFYNAEPFESTLKDVDIYAYYEKAGFKSDGFFYGMPDCFCGGYAPEGGEGRPPSSWGNKQGLRIFGGTK